MKGSRKQENKQSKQQVGNRPIPDVRDDLDSRKEKEENYKDRNNKEGRKPFSKDQNKAGN